MCQPGLLCFVCTKINRFWSEFFNMGNKIKGICENTSYGILKQLAADNLDMDTLDLISNRLNAYIPTE